MTTMPEIETFGTPAYGLLNLAAYADGEPSTTFDRLVLMLAVTRYAPEWTLAAWLEICDLAAQTGDTTPEAYAAGLAESVRMLIDAYPARRGPAG